MLYATDSCSDVHPRGAQTICALLSSTKVLTHDMALLMLLSSSNSTCLELSLQQSMQNLACLAPNACAVHLYP